MLSLLTEHPLICAMALILIDIGLWYLLSAFGSAWRLLVRVVIFSLFSLCLLYTSPSPRD